MSRHEGCSDGEVGRGAALLLGASVCALALLFAGPATAETAAGTVIRNRATLAAETGGVTRSIASNETQLIVAERLDVALARRGDAMLAPALKTVVPLLLTNAGSGQEAFALTGGVDGAQAGTTTFFLDVDGDGRLGNDDTPLTDARSPLLAPGEARALLAVVANGAPGATITLTARAVTGSGAPGTTFAAQGDGGGDAVVGPTGAAASVTAIVAGDTAAATLTKSQAVRDLLGGTTPEPGAEITYTLLAAFDAASREVVVSDAIPVGTALVANSLTLDGAVLTDAADADAGEASAAGIRVALGTVAASTRRTITFRVTIR